MESRDQFTPKLTDGHLKNGFVGNDSWWEWHVYESTYKWVIIRNSHHNFWIEKMAELNQIRRLNKKLRQIERLEGARRKLTLEERTKVPE